MGIEAANIFRYKKKSILVIALISLLIVMTNLYLKNIEVNTQQLNQLGEVLPVYCRITSLDGRKESGLWIKSELLEQLQGAQHVKDLVYTVRMMGGIGEFLPEEWKEHLNLNILSPNTADGVPGDTPDKIMLPEEEQEAFFASREAECLVNTYVMQNRGWKVGDTIELNMYYYLYDDKGGIFLRPLTIEEVTIRGELATNRGAGDGVPIDIVLPVQFVKSAYEKAGVDFMADSAEFYVKNPLELNAFKEEMKSFTLLRQSQLTSASNQGCALYVKDEFFITSATNLQQTISLLRLCFIPICLGLMVIGYLVSFLLLGGRQKEFLLMRALGLKAGRCIGIYSAEQGILVGIGSLTGMLICLFGTDFRVILATVAAVCLFYLAGTLMALWRLSRKNVILLLNMKE